MKQKPKAIALFCGAGGLSLGFERAGFDVIFATDIDSDAIQSYRTFFPSTSVWRGDIRQLDSSALPKNIDILLGGPPCQGFSSAGQKFWDDSRNKLLAEYVRILGALRPKWFLMENVEGLLTAWEGQYICEVVKTLLSLGYNVTLEKIYAHAYGVPQRRKRVVLVGNRLGHMFRFPPHSHNVSGAIFRRSEATFVEATSDLPPATTDAERLMNYAGSPQNDLQTWLRSEQTGISQHFYFAQGDEQQTRIAMLKPGQTMKDLPEELQHESFKRRANRRVCDGTPSERRGGAPSGIKRLVADEPALTITGAAMREFIHPSENRPLSLRECARLQTFPDSFIFSGTSASCLQQIANAVPPLLAETIATYIMAEYGFGFVYDPRLPHFQFSLTQSNGMSPALKKTERMLKDFIDDGEVQLKMFEENRRYLLS
ncbi:MAG: DNA cytosine methyltransferase [Blastocatellia bacterium]|nr:DNA cytosine methyltransferase [Blastocatellia bacterium]